ncbi:MAG: hypothetical protein HFJ65_08525 [Eggerthellaceae bacterium]|nr:hypothetical protein [Eggerthellaceae bacterium]
MKRLQLMRSIASGLWHAAFLSTSFMAIFALLYSLLISPIDEQSLMRLLAFLAIMSIAGLLGVCAQRYLDGKMLEQEALDNVLKQRSIDDLGSLK